MNWFLIVTIVLVVNFKLFAQSSADKDQILEVLKEQTNAWSAGNLTGYMNGFAKTDSTVYIGSTGIIYGWDNTFNHYKKSYPDSQKMGTLSYNIKKVEIINKDKAFVIGAWELKRVSDKPNGYFTLLLHKINNQWRIISNHVK